MVIAVVANEAGADTVAVTTSVSSLAIGGMRWMNKRLRRWRASGWKVLPALTLRVRKHGRKA
jgi:hypothetical protein